MAEQTFLLFFLWDIINFKMYLSILISLNIFMILMEALQFVVQKKLSYDN